MFVKLFFKAKLFLEDQEGASAIEYALVVALVSIVAVASLGDVGTQLKTIFGNVVSALKTAS